MSCALVAALFLDHLHQNNLATLDDLLNVVLATIGASMRWKLFKSIFRADRLDHILFIFDFVFVAVFDSLGDHVAFLREGNSRCARHVIFKVRANRLSRWEFLVGSIGLRFTVLAITTTATTVATRTIISFGAFALGAWFVFIVFGACSFCFRFKQSETICYRNLVVVRMDFRECEETMAIAAIFHERSLKRRFDAGDACEIDIAFELLLVFRLKVEFFNLVAPVTITRVSSGWEASISILLDIIVFPAGAKTQNAYAGQNPEGRRAHCVASAG